ncbi:hypothetical protein OGAPHI_003037 [Ogataea philodendri]|uniref:RRM domain-containing protein n=2 Tax=Saccharomycotina TaxID=147537 RepID=A0A9P8P7V9_9ASCO|nr:uncharacterized protein OGAPHI_003037 [Ogataea philodendri]KAH3667388.1 hypothetical protein OGAPHI_003037 [Ogataea philodendri]
MPPKTKVKMDLGSFLADESFGGSWADEEFDMNTLEVPVSKPTGGRSGGFEERDFERREYPVPDSPPYTARINNLPREILDDDVQGFFADNLKMIDPFDEILDFHAPKDQQTGTLRGFAFITFKNRKTLEDALKLSGQDLGGRVVYVSVAAPSKDSFGGRGGRQPQAEIDWGSMRDGPRAEQRGDRFQGGRAAEPDWGAARTRADAPEARRDRFPRRERAPEPDWSVVRDSANNVPEPRGDRFGPRREPREPREPRVRAPEPDWSAIRNREPARVERAERPERAERADRPPRRERAPEPDWSAARNSVAESARRKSDTTFKPKPKKQEPAIDWSNLRGSALNKEKPREASKSGAKETKQIKTDGPKQSSFNVLSVDDDEDEVEEAEAGIKKLSVEN